MRDDDGRVIQVIGVQHDVSDVVRAQAAVAADRDVARTSLDRAGRIIASQDRAIAELRSLREALTPPDPPARPHLSLASCCLPAEQGVAGDFYLVAPAPGDATVLVVGDVMGHGLEAARRATFIRAALATFARYTDDPLRLLEMTNHALIERVGTSVEFAIGIDIGGSRAELDFPVGRGLLLFTDGLPEGRSAATPRGRAPRLGDERVRALVRTLAGEDPRRVVDALRAEVVTHTSGVAADDVCLVAVRAT